MDKYCIIIKTTEQLLTQHAIAKLLANCLLSPRLIFIFSQAYMQWGTDINIEHTTSGLRLCAFMTKNEETLYWAFHKFAVLKLLIFSLKRKFEPLR